MKSEDTRSSSVYPRIPFRGPSAAALSVAQICSYVASLDSLTVRSTTDTSGVGTRKAIPVNLPFSSGITLPTALAAPVEAGNNILGSTAASSPVFTAGTVDSLLGGGNGMYGCHQTNCLAPLAKVINDNYGILEG